MIINDPGKLSFRALPKLQRWFREKAHRLGYPFSTRGMCHGVSNMAMLSIFDGNFEQSFCIPFQLLHNSANPNEKIKEAQDFFKVLSRAAALEVLSEMSLTQEAYLALLQTTEKTTIEKEFNDKLKKALAKKQEKLSEEEKEKLKYLDILSLFDGVYITQKPGRYAELFPTLKIFYTEKLFDEQVTENKLHIYLSANERIIAVTKNGNDIISIDLTDALQDNVDIEMIKTILRDPFQTKLFSENDNKIIFQIAKKEFSKEDIELKTNVPKLNVHSLESISLSFSKRLEEQGGIHQADQHLGSYSLKELDDYFDLLATAVIKEEFDEPLVLILTNVNHTITVSYDKDNDIWLLINPNTLPVKICKRDEIAEEVMKAFFSLDPNKECVNFSTEVYLNQQGMTSFDSVKKSWQENSTWQKMHEVTAQKINQVDSMGGTLLSLATMQKNFEKCEMFINAGANVNVKSKNGYTPLHLAAMNGDINMVNLFIGANARINQKTNKGLTPLHLAVQKGHLNVTKFLLSAKAEIDAKNKDGFTPLHLAVNKENLLLVETLINAGANIDVATNIGWTPLHLAVHKEDMKVVELLLKKRPDLNKKDNEGWTPLHLAISKENLAMVELLLKAGADVNSPLKSGLTPLHLAVEKGNAEMVALFIKNQANPLTESDISIPRLTDYAEKKGRVLQFQNLIRQWQASPFFQINPLELAAFLGHVEIVKDFLAQLTFNEETILRALSFAKTMLNKRITAMLTDYLQMKQEIQKTDSLVNVLKDVLSLFKNSTNVYEINVRDDIHTIITSYLIAKERSNNLEEEQIASKNFHQSLQKIIKSNAQQTYNRLFGQQNILIKKIEQAISDSTNKKVVTQTQDKTSNTQRSKLS